MSDFSPFIKKKINSTPPAAENVVFLLFFSGIHKILIQPPVAETFDFFFEEEKGLFSFGLAKAGF